MNAAIPSNSSLVAHKLLLSHLLVNYVTSLVCLYFIAEYIICFSISIRNLSISFCRILFPYMSGGDEHISSMGHARLDGFSDSEDYVSIESGEIM